MTHTRMAYMPLATYPEAIADEAVRAAAAFAAFHDWTLSVTTFAVDIPPVSTGLGDFFLDVPGLVRAVEEKSKSECHRLQGIVQGMAGSRPDVHCTKREVVLGAAREAAAAEARYFDLAVLPWSGETVLAQDMAQALVFGSGRPTVLVPPSPRPATLDHIAIAWDASRVAARAVGDALPLLTKGGHISVLTVRGEKPLSGSNIAGDLASSLQMRGFSAAPVEINLGGTTVAEALQETALSEGAQVLAMGGFGHSRIRDFILGGATEGILKHLRLPILLSH